jgi:CHASE2 domain-containing sensor protein
VHDNYLTPDGSSAHPQRRLPGVLVQAHMVSQILSAVLDRRPLLWIWPDWAEGLWIVGWSVFGGIIAWCLRSPFYLGLVLGALFLILYGSCSGSLMVGLWVPFIPVALALVTTVSSIWVSNVRFKISSRNRHLDSESELR